MSLLSVAGHLGPGDLFVMAVVAFLFLSARGGGVKRRVRKPAEVIIEGLRRIARSIEEGAREFKRGFGGFR